MDGKQLPEILSITFPGNVWHLLFRECFCDEITKAIQQNISAVKMSLRLPQYLT